MQGASHTLKSARQYSHPSHFTDKKTKAPTVEFVQRFGSTGFQGIRDGAGDLLVQDHLVQWWFSHV